MITVLSGTPGNGKTAHALDLCWFDKASVWFGLSKYVDGVAGLELEHFEFPDIKEIKDAKFQPLSKVDDEQFQVWNPDSPHYAEFVQARAQARSSIELWFLWAQPGSVIVIDEAQRYYRPRPAGSAVPLHVQMLEYHRHFGIHFLLITQRPMLLHSNVRGLAGQHIHLTDGWRGRHRWEWPEVKDVESKAEKAVAAHTSYKLPKHVFPHYRSSVEHLKVNHSTPLYYKVAMIAAFLVIPTVLFFAWKSWPATELKIASPVAVAPGASFALPVSAVSASDDFMPKVPGRPETAPAFDRVRVVQSMPVISACLQTEKDCRCYTQQATRIQDMTEASCREYLAGGQKFNPYDSGVSHSGFNGAVGGSPSSSAGWGSSVSSRLSMEPVTAQDVAQMVATR